METDGQPSDNTEGGRTLRLGGVAGPVPRSIAPAASFSSLTCRRCGSLLDAPRINPLSGQPGRKCADCGRWQDGPSPFRRWRVDDSLAVDS